MVLSTYDLLVELLAIKLYEHDSTEKLSWINATDEDKQIYRNAVRTAGTAEEIYRNF